MADHIFNAETYNFMQSELVDAFHRNAKARRDYSSVPNLQVQYDANAVNALRGLIELQTLRYGQATTNVGHGYEVLKLEPPSEPK